MTISTIAPQVDDVQAAVDAALESLHTSLRELNREVFSLCPWLFFVADA
jgi:hypothetical protein